MNDPDLYRRIGQLLRRRRRLLGLTQMQVGTACGSTFQQIHKYECGLTAISVARLVRLAAALQPTPSSLLESACLTAEPPCALPEAIADADGIGQRRAD